jgi:dCMP deaminase
MSFNEEEYSKSEPSALRLSKEEYALAQALIASMRSEDPKRKVGAAALTKEGRVIATAYNGLAKGMYQPKDWWDVDENRRTHVIHAEANLCSLIRRGEAHTIACTTIPCTPCALNLVAQGVDTVVYGETYPRDTVGMDILSENSVRLVFIPLKSIRYRILEFIAQQQLQP